MLRLTWVQPEDLIGHELRQAALDGREPSAIAARWRAAGGPEAPLRAGASAQPASRYLRLLAKDLLDELADLPSRLEDKEPTDLASIKAGCPAWPAPAAGSRAARAAPDPKRGGTPQARAGAPALTAPPTHARLEAAWLGRATGCLLGKPVEKLPLEAIRALAQATGNWPLTTYFTAHGAPEELLSKHPWNRRSATTSLAENIDGMPEDDDLNYPLLNLLLLQRHGRHFTPTDVADLWLSELPAGRTFTAERIAYRNLLLGLEPPHTARHRNPFREWIGALIRADVHGWTNPGDPAAAAEQAHRDATLTHTANGVYAAMFTAATIAQAATATHDIHACLRTGLTVIPPHSRLAQAIRHAIRLAVEHADFESVVDELHATHADTHHWVHAVPNTALIAAALTHANGDFTGSICRAVSGGWDTDSNGATAGSIAALLAGTPLALPDRWTTPLKNRLATSVGDFNGIGFDSLAHLTLREASRP
ncbi:ADP-ribosylglycohydrolase family protein [Streptomyces guryensis]|uniref:ADP-ribosylglycohydrolase family protein n=1 Tax=Streptomyces guryensis TaxID=2886947 RepID=A0A9Q3VNE8_9ACTN|nr:ADP-ribosylglycohydrolase family protein [Streptomyces guryensis]MCD9874085.1 ADP-ribosylglycohydrolase family protein [Streptomyces guryensis]